MIVNDLEKVSSLIFSPPAIGKTTLLGTGAADPRIGGLFLIDFEGTALPVRRNPNVTVERANTVEDIELIIEELKKTASTNPFRSVALDTLSAVHIKVIVDIIERTDAIRAKKLESESRGSKEPKLDAMQDQAEQASYLKSFNILRKLIKDIQSLPYHSFFLAHQGQAMDEGLPVNVPLLQGKKFIPEVYGMMNQVWALTRTKDERTGELGERALLFHDVPKYKLKMQTYPDVTVDEYMENPTLPKVWDLFKF